LENITRNNLRSFDFKKSFITEYNSL
jgi:hypothetical protein